MVKQDLWCDDSSVAPEVHHWLSLRSAESRCESGNAEESNVETPFDEGSRYATRSCFGFGCENDHSWGCEARPSSLWCRPSLPKHTHTQVKIHSEVYIAVYTDKDRQNHKCHCTCFRWLIDQSLVRLKKNAVTRVNCGPLCLSRLFHPSVTSIP